MASSAKKSRLDCEADTVDRISNLPIKILDLILERLPLHDAAGTSILSKTWRNIWITHPHLVFDDAFMSRLVSKLKKEQDQLYEVSTTISNILLIHGGPILKFHLFIPRDLDLSQNLTTDYWLKNISNNGVRVLEILNSSASPYRMPSYLFSCVELTHLRLSNCTLNAPLNFGGFRNLISVELLGVIITTNVTFGSQLETLDLRYCTGIKHLGCQFNRNNNLSKLKIIDCEEMNWRWSECTNKVQNLCLSGEGPTSVWKNSINLDKLLGNMPRIYFLFLDGYFLKLLEPADGAVLKRPITTMNNLQTLHLVRVGFYDLVQIQNVLCLIRSSPNLRNLSIVLECPEVKTRTGTVESWAASRVEQYLQLPNLFDDVILDQLDTVDICGIVGSSVDLLFVKLLLASSPSLRWMKLRNSTPKNDPEAKLRFTRQLEGLLPIASSSRGIIYNMLN